MPQQQGLELPGAGVEDFVLREGRERLGFPTLQTMQGRSLPRRSVETPEISRARMYASRDTYRILPEEDIAEDVTFGVPILITQAGGDHGAQRHHGERAATMADMLVENVFTKHSKSFETTIRIKHWQLRDLVKCPFAADDIFVVMGNTVNRYDVGSQRLLDSTVFSFEPTCFGFGDEFLGVAGEGSEFAVNHVSVNPMELTHENAVYSGVLQHRGHVNNAIKITNDFDDKACVFLCNNDGTIKILNGIDADPTRMLPVEIASIECPAPINFCSIQRHRRSLVHVGDDNLVYLREPSASGYHISTIFSEASDAGMSCDWSPAGSMFAVGSQDGLVCVWDYRCKSTIAKIATARAVRSVKFSPSPLDLLAFSEHRGNMHIVDCRMWSNRQFVRVQEGNSFDPDISGFDFSPCGKHLYIGTEDSIEVLKIDTHSRVSFPFAKFA